VPSLNKPARNTRRLSEIISKLSLIPIYDRQCSRFIPKWTAPPWSTTFTSLTLPVSDTWVILIGSKHACISAMLVLSTSFDYCHISYITCVCEVHLAFSCLLFWRISFCLCSFINCHSAWNKAFSIVSQPNTNCDGVALEVVCTVEFMAFWHAPRMPWEPKNK